MLWREVDQHIAFLANAQSSCANALVCVSACLGKIGWKFDGGQRKRLVADIQNLDRLRAVGGIGCSDTCWIRKAQHRGLRALQLHQAVIERIRDEQIAGAVHSNAGWPSKRLVVDKRINGNGRTPAS